LGVNAAEAEDTCISSLGQLKLTTIDFP
jgi:hypothetical protein